MDIGTLDFLVSPEARNALSAEVIEQVGDDIITGRLIDKVTGRWFRLENGIPELTPNHLINRERLTSFCNRYGYKIDQDFIEDSRDLNLDAYREQVNFFRDYQKKYETEVVESPFYKIFDEVTFENWAKNKISKGDLVVEVGCGSGRQSVPLVSLGCRVIGVDLSEEMLVEARKKVINAGRRADFVIAASEFLPIKDGLADAALIFGSLHHFPDPESSVSEVARIVKRGGSFYMVEPHDSLLRPLFDFTMRLSPLWEEEAAEEPLFSAKQWSNWFELCGFKAKITYSTILPPHLFYLTGHGLGVWLLKTSDGLVNLIPGVKRLSGVIVADAYKM